MVSSILTLLFALGFAIGFLSFFWGVVIYFWEVGTNEHGRRHGKAILLQGATTLVILMILFSAVQWIGIL